MAKSSWNKINGSVALDRPILVARVNNRFFLSIIYVEYDSDLGSWKDLNENELLPSTLFETMTHWMDVPPVS